MMYALNPSEHLEYLIHIFFQANQFIKKLPYDIMAIGKSVVVFTTHAILPLCTTLNIAIHFLVMNCTFTPMHLICKSSFLSFILRSIEKLLDRHTNFAPAFKGRYLSSNVNITVFNEEGQVVSVPVGCEQYSDPCIASDRHIGISPIREVQDPKVGDSY